MKISKAGLWMALIYLAVQLLILVVSLGSSHLLLLNIILSFHNYLLFDFLGLHLENYFNDGLTLLIYSLLTAIQLYAVGHFFGYICRSNSGVHKNTQSNPDFIKLTSQ